MGRWILLLGALFSILTTVPAQGQDKVFINVGGWRGGSGTDNSANYQFCSVGKQRSDGIIVILRWGDEGLGFALSDRSWSLEEGAQSVISASIDQLWRGSITGKAYSTDGVDFHIGHDETAVNAFRRGSILTLKIAGGLHRFDLSGSNLAIGSLQDCHAESVASRSEQTELARAPEQVTPDPSSEYRKREQPILSAGQVSAIFAEHVSVPLTVEARYSGLRYHYNISAPQAPGHVSGIYIEVDTGDSLTNEIMAGYLADSERTCPGTFVSDTERSVPVGSSTLLRAFAICDSGPIRVYEGLTILNLGPFALVYIISSDERGLDYAAAIGDDMVGMLGAVALQLEAQ